MDLDLVGGGEKDLMSENRQYSTQPSTSGGGEMPVEGPVDKFMTGGPSNTQDNPYDVECDKSGKGFTPVEDWGFESTK